MVTLSTLRCMQTHLRAHHIQVEATVSSIGKFLTESTPEYTRQEQADLCGVCRKQVFIVLHEYSECLPPRVIRARRYAWGGHGEKTLTEWLRWRGNARLSWHCVARRLRLGWTMERALLTPVRKR